MHTPLTKRVTKAPMARAKPTSAKQRHVAEDFSWSDAATVHGQPNATMPVIQPKLEMSAPNDPLEREADEVANQVMRSSQVGTSIGRRFSSARIAPSPVEGLISRKCSACEREDEPDEQINPKREMGSASSTTVAPSIGGEIASARRVHGTRLAPEARNFLEPRFGQSFDHVRLHVGGRAEQLATNLGARAFTVGSDVFMRQSEYRPATSGGRQLLAHELAHTIQQEGRHPSVQRAGTSRDPFYEITSGQVTDSHELADLLRGLSRTELESLRDALQEFAASEEMSEYLEFQVHPAIDEIGNILTGRTEQIKIPPCDFDPSKIPSSSWLGDDVLMAVKLGARSALRAGEIGPHVALIQSALHYWGCTYAIPKGNYLGKFGADGGYGTRTRRAVEEFQKSRGLSKDGRVGPNTLAVLEEVAVATDVDAKVDEETYAANNSAKACSSARNPGERDRAGQYATNPQFYQRESICNSFDWRDYPEGPRGTISGFNSYVTAGFDIGSSDPRHIAPLIAAKLRNRQEDVVYLGEKGKVGNEHPFGYARGFLVVGYTDCLGDEASNLELRVARSDETRNGLFGLGIHVADPTRVDFAAEEEGHPWDKVADAIDKAFSRRPDVLDADQGSEDPGDAEMARFHNRAVLIAEVPVPLDERQEERLESIGRQARAARAIDRIEDGWISNFTSQLHPVTCFVRTTENTALTILKQLDAKAGNWTDADIVDKDETTKYLPDVNPDVRNGAFPCDFQGAGKGTFCKAFNAGLDPSSDDVGAKYFAEHVVKHLVNAEMTPKQFEKDMNKLGRRNTQGIPTVYDAVYNYWSERWNRFGGFGHDNERMQPWASWFRSLSSDPESVYSCFKCSGLFGNANEFKSCKDVDEF
jgi:hypothetical protein